MSQQGRITILNLAGDLPESLKDYFQKLEIQLLEREECEDYKKLNFILISSEFDAFNACNDYDVDENEIQLICIGDVRQIKTFLHNNGRLVIGPKVVDLEFGKLILEKFFTQTHDIHLEQSFPTLLEDVSDFKLTNHLSTGYYSDEIALDSFAKGFNVGSIRSFLDHTILYLTYLKQAGLAGIPFQVEYAGTEEVYAVNVHLSVKNFVAEYIIDSFGNVNSKEPLQYLLGVIKRSCDFLDICYIEKANKLKITGLWSTEDDKGIKGVAFNNIFMVAQNLKRVERKIKEYESQNVKEEKQKQSQNELENKRLPGDILSIVLDDEDEGIFKEGPAEAKSIVAFVVEKFTEEFPDKDIEELTEDEFEQIVSDYPNEEVTSNLTAGDREKLQDRAKKNNITKAYSAEVERVKGKLEDDDDYKKELTDTLSEEVAQKVTGKLDIDEAINRVLGSKDQGDSTQVVKGGKEAANKFMSSISGLKDDKGQFLAKISQSVSDQANKSGWNVSIGGKNSENKLRQFVNNALSSTSSDVSPTVRSFLQNKAPDVLHKKLQEHAKKLNLAIDALPKEELQAFESTIPDLLQNLVSGDEVEAFKNELMSKDEIVIQSAEKPSDDFTKKLKEKIESKLKAQQLVEKEGDRYKISAETSSSERVQSILKNSVKELLEEDFAINKANQAELNKTQQDITTTLTESLNMKTEDVESAVKDAAKKVKEKENAAIIDNLFGNEQNDNKGNDEKDSSSSGSFSEGVLLEKLNEANKEKEGLEKNVRMIQSKLEAADATIKKLQEVSNVSKQKALEMTTQINEQVSAAKLMSNEEKKNKLNALKNGELSSEDAQKLAEALEKEAEIIEVAKNAETVVRKIQHESTQKEQKFISDVNRYNKLIKSKDAVVEKAKESMKYLSEKKEAEKQVLVKKVEELNKRLDDSKLGELKFKVRELKSENDLLKRSEGNYKKKVEILTKKMSSTVNKDITRRMQEENRLLKNSIAQLEGNQGKDQKQIKTLESQLQNAKQAEHKARNEHNNALAQIKTYESQIRQLKEGQSKLVAQSNNGSSENEKKLIKEIELSKHKLSAMQKKISELSSKNKSPDHSTSLNVGNEGARKKKLEQDLKKVQSELTKAKTAAADQKKEVLKMKGENTGLKNQIKALKADLERAKKGAKTSKKVA